MKTQVKSMILLLLTAIIWGFAFVAQRTGGQYVGTFTYNGIRFCLGTLSLIPVILIFEREKRDPAKWKRTLFAALLCGVILFIASTLQQIGVNITQSAGKGGFITGLYTVLVPIIGFLFLKRKVGWNAWLGAFLAVIGLFLLSINLEEGETFFGWGELVLLIGSVFWAMHIIVIDRFVESISPLKFAMGQFFVCAVLSMLGAVLTEEFVWSNILSAGPSILYGGLMSVGVAYTLQILGQKDAEPTIAAIVLSTESMFSAIGGILILGETLPGRGYFGCVLIFAGIILSQLVLKKKTTAQKS